MIIPRNADTIMNMTGESVFLKTTRINIIIRNKITEIIIAGVESDLSIGIKLHIDIYTPVARIIPVTLGLTPRKTARKYLLFSIVLNTTIISRIMTNAGSMTATVDKNAPAKPQILLPMYVARFTIIGPGVLSLTAIIYVRASSLSQSLLSIISRIIGIAP